MRTEQAKCCRGRTAIAIAIAAVVVAAGCASTADRSRGRPEAASKYFAKCSDSDAWATSEQVTAENTPSYYSVVFQLASCVKGRDYPISIDLGPSKEKIANGKSMQEIGGYDGAGVFVTNPHTRDPFTGEQFTDLATIPQGDGEGGFGPIAMFATVPYWEGPPNATADQDPACANTVANKPGQTDQWGSPLPTAMSTLNPCQPEEVVWNDAPPKYTGGAQRFEGMWALYLPSETIVVSVVPPNMWPPENQIWQGAFPFPYVPDPSIATGVVVARYMPGMVEPHPPQGQSAAPRQLAIYEGASGQDYGTNPTGFTPTSCWDMVTLRDGNTADPKGAPTTTTTTTSTTRPVPWNPGGPPTLWTFHVNNDPDEYPNTYPYDFVVSVLSSQILSPGTNYLPSKMPVLFFPAGYQYTDDDGRYQAIPLRKPARSTESKWASFKSNESTGRVQHFLQFYLRNPAGDQAFCGSGLTATANNAVAIGGVLDGVPWSSAMMTNAVLTNSSLQGAALVNADLTGANLAYANLSGANLTNAMLTDANLTGANLTNAKLAKATMKRTNLFMTDFTGADFPPGGTDPKTPSLTGAKFCQTKGINTGQLDPNQDCIALRRSQLTARQAATPTGRSTPDNIPAGCLAGTCVLVSVYNNSSRTYAQGLNWCANTEQNWRPPMQSVPPGNMPGQQAGIIAPLDSAQLMFQTGFGGMNCFVTFANGADGYYTIRINNNGKFMSQATVTIDEGACGQLKAKYSNFTCTPPSLDASKPTTAIVMNATTGASSNQRDKATLVDVMICDPTFPVIANLPPTTTTTTGPAHC